MIFRKARPEEVGTCFRFIEEAVAYQHSLGFVQWHPDYPTRSMLEEDIELERGYVFAEGDTPLGYCCLIVGDEPAYHEIDGAWKTERPYGVVHRMAFGSEARGRGLAGDAFREIKRFLENRDVHAIRIDTHRDNKVMQRVLAREGFSFCGIIEFDGPKRAYEWDG